MALTPKTRATKLAHRQWQGRTLCRNCNDHVDVIATDKLFYAYSWYPPTRTTNSMAPAVAGSRSLFGLLHKVPGRKYSGNRHWMTVTHLTRHMSTKMLRNNTTTDILTTGMGHGADVDSSLFSTIDSSILFDDVDNIIPSKCTTTAVRIVRKLSRDLFRARLLEHFGILLRRRVIRWPSRIGLPLSYNVRAVLRGAPCAEQALFSTPMELLMIQANNQLSNNQL
jgi:hypothetical protein